MNAIPSEPRRGRPRDPVRVQRVLETAARYFLEAGFERTSVEAIAQASGISKVTIYRYFPTKEALFNAAITSCTDEVFGSLPPGALSPDDPKTALTLIGKAFLKLKRSDDVVRSFRLMYAAAGEHGDACLAFYRRGPEKIGRQLADYLRAAASAGSLSIRRPEEAADQFLALFLGSAHVRVMLGLGKPTAAEDKRLVRANVETFLRAYAI